MIEIDARNIQGLTQMLDAMPNRTRQAMALAINQTTKRTALKLIREDMMKQVNFKKSYLMDKVTQSQYANPNNLVGKIRGRSRPTMLSRFMESYDKKRGVKVRVKPTRSVTMKKAFAVKLKSGNVGILVRPKNGGTPRGVNNGGARYISKMRAWLLYAPSIDQLMHETSKHKEREIMIQLEREFLRQFARLK